LGKGQDNNLYNVGDVNEVTHIGISLAKEKEWGQQGKVQGIPRDVAIREIPAMQLKKSFKKGCQIFAAHMEEAAKGKMPSIEDHPVYKYFEDVFREILGFPPKRYIDFSIDLVPGVAPMSKTPYRMRTPVLKDL